MNEILEKRMCCLLSQAYAFNSDEVYYWYVQFNSFDKTIELMRIASEKAVSLELAKDILIENN